jgi:hypothetical protein
MPRESSIFWDIPQRSLVKVDTSFGETFHFHLTACVMLVSCLLFFYKFFKLAGWDFGYYGHLLAYCTSPE